MVRREVSTGAPPRRDAFVFFFRERRRYAETIRKTLSTVTF
jgi:hypothetical protein